MTGPVTLAPLDFEKALRVIETPTGWGTREYEAELQRQARAYAEALVATANQYLDRVCVAMGEAVEEPLAAVLAVEMREATWQKACDTLKSGPGWPERMWPSLDDRIRYAAVIARAEAAEARVAAERQRVAALVAAVQLWECGDINGGDVQDEAVRVGVIQAVEVTEPCHPVTAVPKAPVLRDDAYGARRTP